MRAVNLLPKDAARSQRKPPNPAVLVGGGGGSLVVGLLALFLMGASGEVAEKQTALDLAQRELAVVPAPPPGPTSTDLALTDQRTQRVAALSTALAERVAWDRVLRRFSLVLPEDIWLTSLAAAAPGDEEAGSASGFTITGYTYSHDAVARLLSRIAVVPDLANVQLRRSTLSEVEGRPVVEFEIGAEVRKAGAAS